jgi:hypothetical protein
VFRRWNDRPTTDVALDLTSHDVDLARWLGVSCPVRFDSRADAAARVRSVLVHYEDKPTARVDLMAHDTSPLHAQWNAFLSDKPGCASLSDAVLTLAALRLAPRHTKPVEVLR